MKRAGIALLTASIALLAARPAAAELVLSFDQSTYTLAGVGQTVDVKVFLSEDADGSSIGVGNELISAGVTISFATSGAAIVAASGDVTPGSGWDAGVPIFSTVGANTLVDLGLVSFDGFSDLSTPLPLGAFKFTARAAGDTVISVSALGPGPSFGATRQDLDDPAGGEAAIKVSAIPEPSALFSASVAAATLAAVAARRRRTAA